MDLNGLTNARKLNVLTFQYFLRSEPERSPVGAGCEPSAPLADAADQRDLK